MTPPGSPSAFKVRRWRPEDIKGIGECQRAAYPDYPESGQYGARIFELQIQAFPEGQFLVEHKGQIVAYATSLIVELEGLPHLYESDELTGTGTFSTHTPGGNTLYGADIAVHPDFRGKGVAGRLYLARKRLLRRYNLRRMVAYGRVAGYGEYAGRLTAKEYVAAVESGELKDSALSAHLEAGYHVRQVSLEIMRDEPSRNWATLLEFENPDYDPKKRRIGAARLATPVRKIRVCAAQYYMRPMAGNAGSVQSRNHLLNYACSAVLCPSDFGFPDAAVIAEADPNIETVVVADLDLTSLANYRQDGSVRPLNDRRLDLYDVVAKTPLEIVTVE